MIKLKLLKTLIIILTIEKIAQHLISAAAFIVDVPWIGRPDIGPFFNFGNETMAIMNLILFGVFLMGLLGEIKEAKWAFCSVLGGAVIDILLEFVFHGLFYITISVLVSTMLIITIIISRRKI